jgi:hypothetical protein
MQETVARASESLRLSTERSRSYSFRTSTLHPRSGRARAGLCRDARRQHCAQHAPGARLTTRRRARSCAAAHAAADAAPTRPDGDGGVAPDTHLRWAWLSSAATARLVADSAAQVHLRLLRLCHTCLGPSLAALAGWPCTQGRSTAALTEQRRHRDGIEASDSQEMISAGVVRRAAPNSRTGATAASMRLRGKQRLPRICLPKRKGAQERERWRLGRRQRTRQRAAPSRAFDKRRRP